MKRLLSFLSLLLVAVSSFAQQFTVGDITYKVLSEEDKTAQVYNGQNATGDVVVPETVTYNDVDYRVTTVYGNMIFVSGFRGNKNITSISLPSVTTIDSYAFYNCSSLESVSLPAATTIGGDAFRQCSSLESVELLAATSIGRNAFQNCSKINSLRIGSVEQWCNVNFEGDYANPTQSASQNVELYVGNSETPATSIEVPSTVTSIPNYAFCRTTITSVTAPGATSIEYSAFYNCSSLAAVELPAATSIDHYTFYNCSSLASIGLPVATSIGSSAFDGCSSLTSVDIPAVISLGSKAFSGCSSLASVELPAATSIGSYAFQGCESLEEAIMPKVETVGYQAFGYMDSYDENGNWAPRSCKSLSRVDLSSVKTIEDRAFSECSNISSLRIGSVEQWCKVNFGGDYTNPLQQTSQTVTLYVGNSETPAKDLVASSSLTEIPNYAFYRISNIENISAPAVTSIGEAAFESCISLASFELSAATSIGGSAFKGTALTSVNLPAATTIGSYAFQGCESLEEAIMPKVETIGYQAFGQLDHYDENDNWAPRYCKSLARVDLSSVKSIENYAFQGCSNISSLRIGSVDQWCQVNFGEYATHPLQVTSQAVTLYVGNSETPAKDLVASNALTEIPNYAFYRISNIENISAPAATSIGYEAFANCTSLASIVLPVATNIGHHAFSGTALTSANLPAATSIGDAAFEYCASLASVNLPIATTIGGAAFESCTSLASVSLLVATTIGGAAFESCTSLASVNLPVATTIGGYAFFDCRSLASIDLPEATSVGEYAFHNCSSLEEALLSKTETLGTFAFFGASTLKSVDLSSAQTIGEYAFSGCRVLSRLYLPEVREIGLGALEIMSSLKDLTIPKVEKIGAGAFSGTNIDNLRIGSVEQYCNIDHGSRDNEWYYKNSFPWHEQGKKYIFIGDSETPATEITIPETVQQIPEYAFLGTGIHTIHYEGMTPPALESTNSFSDWTMLAVPEEAYETYLAADVYNTIPLRITKDGHITQDLEVEAKSTTSALLAKVGDQEIRNVVNLKLTGTINSYDMLIIRNRMTSLRNLDLSEASIVDCDYVYSTSGGNSYHSVKDEVTGDWLLGLMNVKLPANTKVIGYGAFRDCNRLVSVDIPDGVESIESYAFSGCSRIKEFTLPQSVTSFGAWAFDGCTGLREVVIPDGVTSITSYAFSGCRDLEKVTIPASVKNIGYYAFTDVGNEYWDEYGNYHRTPISLRISDINSWLDTEIGEYWSNNGSFDNVGTLFIGDSDEPVENIVIPAGTTELKRNTFAGFGCLKSITLPDELTTIGNGTFSRTGLTEVRMPENLNYVGSYAFSGCANLENVEFTDSLKTIGESAFSGCSNLKKIELPAYLQTIGSYAFRDCSSLTEVLIPASIQEIGDYAFIGCGNLNKVIATTVEPININQNTFSTYRTASVYSPRTSYWKYYWNTQWNQFLSVREYGRHRYKYFYLRGHHGGKKEDFEIDDETGTLEGTENEVTGEEKAPDADFGEEAGIIVGGSQIQELGDIHIHHNGNNGASMIAKQEGKVHIDNLYVDIKTQKNRWYFFCFPFDIQPGQATFDGSHVWYLYDGEARALNGNGGWKKVANDGVMQSGNGYIFQGAVNGTLTIHVQDITIDTSDNSTNMITYQSDNKNDASWNLIGNANYAYYGISDLMLDVPVTVYDNETGNYEAVRAGDDDYEFYPFQAFFVQKPESTESVDFENSKKDTKNKSDEKKAKKAAARAAAPKQVDATRQIINLELASAEILSEGMTIPTDRTRIVVNAAKSLSYEPECDAAKFIADGMPQIYSLDANNTMYAINERPAADGIVNLAVKIPEDGCFTITAPRLDCGAKLRDLETGTVIDLAKDAYTFVAEGKTYTNRFQLLLTDVATSIMTPEAAEEAIEVESGAIVVNNPSADVKIYTAGGVLVAAQSGIGRVTVRASVYVVNVNGQSVKVTVNE